MNSRRLITVVEPLSPNGVLSSTRTSLYAISPVSVNRTSRVSRSFYTCKSRLRASGRRRRHCPARSDQHIHLPKKEGRVREWLERLKLAADALRNRAPSSLVTVTTIFGLTESRSTHWETSFGSGLVVARSAGVSYFSPKTIAARSTLRRITKITKQEC